MNLSLADITTAIVAALQADLGTFDLSGTDAVKLGDYAAPPASVPFAAVLPPSVRSDPSQGRARWFVRTVTYTIRLWGSSTVDDPGNRTARATLLMDEAITAIESARRTGSNMLYRCVTFNVAGAVLDRAPANAAGQFAMAELQIELTYRRTTGTGG